MANIVQIIIDQMNQIMKLDDQLISISWNGKDWTFVCLKNGAIVNRSYGYIVSISPEHCQECNHLILWHRIYIQNGTLESTHRFNLERSPV